MRTPPLTDEGGEVRELAVEDMALFRPVAEVDAGMIEAMKASRNKGGRPRTAAPKAHIAFRWNPQLVATIKASGKNYNARVEKILDEACKAGKL